MRASPHDESSTLLPMNTFPDPTMKIILTFCCVLLFTDSVSAKGRPDLVVFLSDDHTWRDSSVYGSEEIDTPNMARLAGAGMTFDRAYVASPSCAPSRAAMLTGLYPSNNGAEPNHSRPREAIRKLPSYLQELGYEVVSFGKVGHYKQTSEYGFDLARHFDYHEDIAIPKAIEWLKMRQSDQPLCLFVGSNWPHVPWPENTDEIATSVVNIPPTHVNNDVTRAWRRRYLAAVKTMDDELGAVHDAAREVLGEDVFFLHTSDHGAQWPFEKWNTYEGGVRTPLIVSWPGRIATGKRTDAMVSWIDLLPTLVDVAGGVTPDEIDGRSFAAVLRGEAHSHREHVFTTHSGDGNHNVFPSRAVIDADGWKLIRNLHPEFRFESHTTEARQDGGYWDSWLQSALDDETARDIVRRYQNRPAEEFFKTDVDSFEQDNLVDDPDAAEKRTELRRVLDGWMTSTGDTKMVYGRPKRKARPGSPNIINVFIDDMGYIDMSCFGGKKTKTEHLDLLASEGIRFKNFYVNSPICSPSRVAMTTGQYPFRWKISSYLANRKRNRERGMAQWLDPAAPVLARELQYNGYATGHFGKWHMGGQRDVGNAPLISEYGFDRSLTNFEGLGPRVLGMKNAHDGKQPQLHSLGSNDLPTGPITQADRSFVTKSFVDGAIDFIDKAKAQGKPFYVNVWPDDVHGPWFPPKEKRAKTDGSQRGLHYAVVDAMDEQLGPLFERIRGDDSLCDNTIILVSSDNGHEDGAGLSDPFRGAKTWLYEGGIRSPLIVWGPGLLAPGTAGTSNDSAIFAAMDLNRSLYAITDTPLPDNAKLDGENVADALLGKSKTGRQAPIFFRRPPDRPGTKSEDNPDLAVRDGVWKYLVNFDGSDPQLYHLVDDVSETDNLVIEQPDVVGRLHKAVMKWNELMPVDAGAPDFGKVPPLSDSMFVNPIGEGADPWVVPDEANDRYLWCYSDGNRAIGIHTSANLSDLGTRHIVWRAPETGPYSREIWAPELHYIGEKWYVYFAASDGKNENHLAYVLESNTDDPLGEYTLHGPLATGDGADGRSPNVWAIDMTPLQHAGKLYAMWSGWDQPGSDRQYLYIAPMESPTKLSGPRVRVTENNEHPWEFTEDNGKGRGLHEGPQVLKHNDHTSVVYSCGASWLPTYKLGLLELTGDDPLQPSSWTKLQRPVFTSTPDTFGVGHSCFVASPDGSEMWHVYHAKQDREPGWQRGIFIQPMSFDDASGRPRFGRPVPPGKPIKKPSGEVIPVPLEMPLSMDLRSENARPRFAIYSHHQRYRFDSDGLHLGQAPADPVNDFSAGEKAMLRGRYTADLSIETTFRFKDFQTKGAAGILFRNTGAGLGYDAHRGYFADLNLKNNTVNLGKMNGRTFEHLKASPVQIDASQIQRLSVQTQGNELRISFNGELVLTHRDPTYPSGGVGLRAVRTPVVFESLQLKP